MTTFSDNEACDEYRFNMTAAVDSASHILAEFTRDFLPLLRQLPCMRVHHSVLLSPSGL
jgi:hypothetical protein